jgi:dihydrodipicolinate synthase/N-acetylneuraminate lyase
VQLHNALTSKSADAHGLFERIKTLRALYAHTPGAACVIRTIKGALATLGICGPHLAPPFEPATPAEQEKIRRQLHELKLP